MRKSEYPRNPKTLGQKIRKKRMDLGIKIRDLAKKVGVSEAHILLLEQDRRPATPRMAALVANALNEDICGYFNYAMNKIAKDHLRKLPKNIKAEILDKYIKS